MVRHGLDPASGFPSTTLVEWRREISGAFRKTLDSHGLFHPSDYPAFLRRAINERKIVLPDRITLTGFESPAPLEQELFVTLEENSDVEYANPPKRRPEKIEALALPSPEQEVIYLVHRLAGDARTMPLHSIGVIVPDMNRYAQTLESSLRDVTAEAAPSRVSLVQHYKGYSTHGNAPDERGPAPHAFLAGGTIPRAAPLPFSVTLLWMLAGKTPSDRTSRHNLEKTLNRLRT